MCAALRPASLLHSLFSTCCWVQATSGQMKLTRCTLRKCSTSPPGHMPPDRKGAIQLTGPATVTVQHCYVEVCVGWVGWGGRGGACCWGFVQQAGSRPKPRLLYQGQQQDFQCLLALQGSAWICRLRVLLYLAIWAVI
jgi:hypothetical protein